MTTVLMTGAGTEASARRQSKAAGGLWLTCIVTGVFAFVARFPLIAGDDAAATAANILANESLFRLGFVADLISGASYVGVTALLYGLLKPAGRSQSLLAAFFGLVGVAVGGVGYVNHLASLILLGGEPFLGAFTTSQLQAVALVAIKLQLQVFSIGLVFFGTQCLLAGYLIVRSTFLPRALGVLLAIGGTSYVSISFVNFLWPSLGARLTPFVMPVALIGEGALTVWLLAKGVNVVRWKERAGVAAEPVAAARVAHSAQL